MTTTRILLALALVAAAVLVYGQQPGRWNNHGTPGKPHLEVRPVCFAHLSDDCFVPRIPRPRNGQCPVCGTMAKPVPPDIAPFLKSRHVACEHCNTVFRQWAEGKEPKR